jgi:Transcriptional regulator of aromatic amino acids metabolism
MLKALKTMREEMKDHPCLHCKHNPKAVPPLKTMHEIDLTPLTEALVTKYSEQVGIPKSCILCFAVRTMCKSDIDFMEVLHGRK